MNDARLVVPVPDQEPWSSLGPEVCDWIETHLVHGPGDVLGEPIVLTDEQRLFLYRAYEVYPHGHEREGRRRFKRAVKSRRKGVGKTEDAALIALVEFDPSAPARCDGFHVDRGEWVPVGRPVRDPYIPMVAVTEEQTEDLAYAAVREILSHCELGESYDIGLERIRHLNAPGQIQALASSPNARDGARTTFQHFDETHLFVLERLKAAHKTMLRNIPKRYASDAWSLETTTAYEPGEDSIAEGSHLFALAILQGRAADATLLYDHRQASTKWDIRVMRELRAAIKEASGDAYPFTDVESIISLFNDPQETEANKRRFWLNQPTVGDRRWIAPEVVAALVEAGKDRPRPLPLTPIVLTFDGSYSRDSTALVGTTIEAAPHVFVLGVWEKPIKTQGWRVSHLDVDAAVEDAMRTFDVREFAPDPFGWHADVERWEETYGDVVVRFETNQPRRFGPACSDFIQAARDTANGTVKLSIENNEPLRRHLSNAVTKRRSGYDLADKKDPDSPDKIDLADAAIVGVHRALWHFLHPPVASSWRPL